MKIISEDVSYKNRRNENISGIYDYADYVGKNGIIIIPPAYGETKKDSLKIAYFLAKNGFGVLRYDATCHIGESDGDMVNAELEKMRDDLSATLDFSEDKFKSPDIGIVGSSLGIRVAIKAIASDSRIKFLLGLVPIVDIQSSLKAIYHQDIIREVLEGRYKGKTIDDIMGFEVSVNFAVSAIRSGYHDLKSTQEDMKRINIPLILICAQNDSWVDINAVKNAMDFSPSADKEFIIIPDSMHQLNENIGAAGFALRQIVLKAKKYLCAEELQPDDVAEPAQEELGAQWLREEERFKNLIRKSLEGEKEFWEKYLNKFVLIHKSSDYREFLNQITGALDIRPGEKILDAGCGNGHFGAWIFKKIIKKIFAEKIKLENFTSIQYTGLDFVENSLKEARHKHFSMTRRVYREFSLRDKYPVIKYRYVLADLAHTLPLPDNYFDKICCNLVISYVKDPQSAINELTRILKPGGRLIISSMKPYADLSQIYKNFADNTADEEELEEARKLLSAAGRIRQKESAGFYRFFPEAEMESLFKNAGIKNTAIVRTFSNQANVISGDK